MMQTLSFLRAHIHRAQQDGASSMVVDLRDLEEIVRAAEAHTVRDQGQQAKKSAGWVRPGSLQGMRSGLITTTKIRRHRTEDHCVELFFAGNLTQIMQAQKAGEPPAAEVTP